MTKMFLIIVSLGYTSVTMFCSFLHTFTEYIRSTFALEME